MNLRISILAIIALSSSISFTQTINGAWVEIVIPASIQTNQRVEACPNGWQAYDEIGNPNLKGYNRFDRFRGVTVYSGHPSELASLEPDSERENKATNAWVSLYKLAPVMKDGFWLKCTYSETRLALCLQIPQQAKELRVTTIRKVSNTVGTTKVEYR